MKANKIILASILIFFLSYSFAASPGGENLKKVKNQISQHLDYPKFLKSENERVVFVDLSISNDGKIKINEIYGHDGFREYVVNQLNKVSFNPKKYASNESFLFKFSFK